jgi:putative redox protein
MASNVVVRAVSGERFTQIVEAGKHQLFADELKPVGGSDRGPGPYEYLLTALGARTSMTLRMYAERKNIALRNVEVSLTHKCIHDNDCEDCETEKGMLDEIHSEIHLEGDLDEVGCFGMAMKIINRHYAYRTHGGLNGAFNTGSNRRRALGAFRSRFTRNADSLVLQPEKHYY